MAYGHAIGCVNVYECGFVCDGVVRIIILVILRWKPSVLLLPKTASLSTYLWLVGDLSIYMNLWNAYILCIAAHLDVYQSSFPYPTCPFVDLIIDESYMWTNEHVVVSCSVLQYALSIFIIKSDFSAYGSLSQSNVSSSMLALWLGMIDLFPWSAWRHVYLCTP